MTKFLFVYHAPMTPAEAAPADPGADGGRHGCSGTPGPAGSATAWSTSAPRSPAASGSPPTAPRRAPARSSATRIIEAADMDAALTLAKGHPHLNMPGGCEIEVHEAQPIPGM